MLLNYTDSLLAFLATLNWVAVALFCLLVFICWRASMAVCQYLNRPRNIAIAGKTLLFGQWLSVLDFILGGADIISTMYPKAKKLPFAISAINNYQVLVSSQEHMQELAQASEDVLSFRKGMNERLFFKYTMWGFTPNEVDPHNAIPNRVFKVLARENLPNLSRPLAQRIAEVWNEFFEAGQTKGGASEVALHILSGTMIARMNNQLLFGEELATNPTFEKQSIKYGWHSSIAMEMYRHVPAVLVPVVAKVFMAWSGAMYQVGAIVQSFVDRRIEVCKKGVGKEHLDCTEWVMQASHTPLQLHPTRMAQQMMGLLFASTHQMQMVLTWAIIDLCLHPEYIAFLRSEIQTAFSNEKTRDPYDQLQLMESFLRESSRFNTLDALNVQRKAMQSYTFAGGFHVPAGNLIAIPQREIMRDPTYYSSPETFNPYRFMTSSASGATAKYTDVNWSYPFWGSPRMSCPGRWYASYAIKHALVQLLTTYDFELMNPEAKKSFIWTTSIVPRSNLQILLRRR